MGPKVSSKQSVSGRQSGAAVPGDISSDMRLLLSAIDEHCMISIADGAGIIVHVNKPFARAAGLSTAELVGKSYAVIRSDEHPDAFFADLWTTVARGDVWRGRIRNRASDGRSYWVDTTIVPFIGEGPDATRYAALQTDVTHMVELEGNLAAANQELADMGTIQSNFLAAMSHDLRTPLNSIIGFTDIINEGLFGPIGNKRYAEYLQSVNGSAKHLLTLVTDILDFSIMEATGYKFQLERYDPVEQTKTVAKTFDWIAREKKLEIVVAGGSRAPNSVLADPRVATQIQTNLIANACRHSPQGGLVTITWDRDENGDVFLEIGNDGDPIPDEIIQGFGRPFLVRNPMHASDTEKSYGLGLYICHRFIDARGGKLVIGRNDGVGALVRATWPAGVLKPLPA